MISEEEKVLRYSCFQSALASAELEAGGEHAPQEYIDLSRRYCEGEISYDEYAAEARRMCGLPADNPYKAPF